MWWKNNTNMNGKMFTPIFSSPLLLIKLVYLLCQFSRLYNRFQCNSFTFRFSQWREEKRREKNEIRVSCRCCLTQWCLCASYSMVTMVFSLFVFFFFFRSHTILTLLCVLFWFHAYDNLCLMMSNAQFTSNLATDCLWAYMAEVEML